MKAIYKLYYQNYLDKPVFNANDLFVNDRIVYRVIHYVNEISPNHSRPINYWVTQIKNLPWVLGGQSDEIIMNEKQLLKMEKAKFKYNEEVIFSPNMIDKLIYKVVCVDWAYTYTLLQNADYGKTPEIRKVTEHQLLIYNPRT